MTYRDDAFENIQQAAVRASERGGLSGSMPKFTAQLRKQLVRMEAELTREWKSGKSIQRKQALKFLPWTWNEMYQLPLQQMPPDNPIKTCDSGYSGYERFAALAGDQLLMILRTTRVQVPGPAVIQAGMLRTLHTALYPVWSYMQAIRFGSPNVFSVRDSLVEKLMNTDIDNVHGDDVRLPLPCIYVSMPFGEKTLLMRNEDTGLHEITLISIAEGERDGERALFCVFYGEPRSDGSSTTDDHVYSFSFGLPSDGSLRELLDRRASEDAQQLRREGIHISIQHDMLRFYDESFNFEDGLALLRRFVINFCLYLSSPGADIEPTKSGQGQWDTVRGEPQQRRTSVRVSHSKGKRRSSKKVEGGADLIYTTWDVGRNVTKLQRTLSATDILVRGHFRRQAHGAGRLLRKIIWIEPHIRLATGEEPQGHEYKVESNRV